MHKKPLHNESHCFQVFWSYLAFWLLNRVGLLRVNLEAEAIGMDASHMGAHHVMGVEMENIMGTKVSRTSLKWS